MTTLPKDVEWGKIAYEAYRQESARRLPGFERLSKANQRTWTRVALAVRMIFLKKTYKARG